MTVIGSAILALTEDFWAGIVTTSIVTIGGVAVAVAQRPSRRKARAEAKSTQAAATLETAEVNQEVRNQMRPNGGSTFRDALDRIDNRTAALTDRVSTMDNRSLNMERRQLAMEDSIRTITEHILHLSESQAKVVPEVQRISDGLVKVTDDVAEVKVTIREAKQP